MSVIFQHVISAVMSSTAEVCDSCVLLHRAEGAW